MRIGVTGATGRLGTAVLKELLGRVSPDQIVAIARDPARITVKGVETRPGNYGSVTEMAAAFAGLDTILMISAPVAEDTDRMAMHINVIEAAKQAGVDKVVYTSVIGNALAEGTLFAPFRQINRDTEAALQYAGMDWIIARNGLYLDLDLLHIKHADKHGGVYRNNAGTGRCGYISIGELGFALAGLLVSDTCNGRIVNLVGESNTQAELVAFANSVYGLKVSYEAISLEENIVRFMADERIAARGEAVAKMLSGCFECIEKGGFDVPSDYELAAGRAPHSIPEQMALI